MHLTDRSIPALLYFRKSIEEAGAAGTVLFSHGLTASKEVNAKELQGIAERGFLAVGIDNAEHGERYTGEIEAPKEKEDFAPYFLGLVTQTVGDIPGIIDFLVARGYSDPEKMGMSGISMGGYITYGAVIADSRLKVAAPILGSPQWKHSGSPHLFPDRFYPTALLSQNAGRDEHVPAHYARSFHEQLLPYYRGAEERLRFVEFPEEPHFMSERSWNRLWENTLDWLEHWM